MLCLQENPASSDENRAFWSEAGNDCVGKIYSQLFENLCVFFGEKLVLERKMESLNEILHLSSHSSLRSLCIFSSLNEKKMKMRQTLHHSQKLKKASPFILVIQSHVQQRSATKTLIIINAN